MRTGGGSWRWALCLASGLVSMTALHCSSPNTELVENGSPDDLEPPRRPPPATDASATPPAPPPPECARDEARCTGAADIQRCDNTGNWGIPEACASGTPVCAGGECVPEPQSCLGMIERCGANEESCCTSNPVPGGDFRRSRRSDLMAKVSPFRLDKYPVTVGRFRRFVDAVVGGWRPDPGSGKHTHLYEGDGLINSGANATDHESGWEVAWNTNLYASRTRWNGEDGLACSTTNVGWSANRGARETWPINCINWFQAYAFCIFDGGFLPSGTEYEFAAAGGSEEREYPWGNDAPGANAELLIHGCFYRKVGDADCKIAPVGSVPAGDGRYGHSDLSGNLYQWGIELGGGWRAGPCTDCARTAPEHESRNTRGSAYNTDELSRLSSYSGTEYAMGNRAAIVGVRCARTP